IDEMRTSPGATARRLLGHLVAVGPAHRADLSRALGVSRTTVTNLVSDLTGSGVLSPLERDGATRSAAQRPPLKQQLAISARCGVLLSVVFRMTSVTATVGALDGRVLASDSEEFSRELPGTERMEIARALFEHVLADCDASAQEVLRLHLAVNTEQAAGPWRGTNPKQLAEAWSPAVVTIENTARLTGLAEYHALGDPEPRSLVYVHLSWGVTMGQVVDGAIVAGSHGGAGEL